MTTSLLFGVILVVIGVWFSVRGRHTFVEELNLSATASARLKWIGVLEVGIGLAGIIAWIVVRLWR